ncbi:MAG: PilZ domain-containing protein [Marinagarivorans sp.]|nr:PilZ domain-containing protein [Marinagarivorans sp.]
MVERRRYFRINDTVKLSYRQLDKRGNSLESSDHQDLIAEQDRRMEVLISELKTEHPKMIELIALLNQKLERLSPFEKHENTVLAYRAREVNMSACGLAFSEDDAVAIGSQLMLYLILANGQKMILKGLVIGCQLERDQAPNENDRYNWRVDFINLTEKDQELLIQNIVQRQSAQLGQNIKIVN